jgi:hypothetical protein
MYLSSMRPDWYLQASHDQDLSLVFVSMFQGVDLYVVVELRGIG